MTRQQLAQAGRALYGPEWHARLADDLDADARTVRLWAAGERFIPVPAQSRIRRLLDRKMTEVSKVLDLLD